MMMYNCEEEMTYFFQLHVTQGVGQFVETPPNCQYVYGRVNVRDEVRWLREDCVIFLPGWNIPMRQ